MFLLFNEVVLVINTLCHDPVDSGLRRKLALLAHRVITIRENETFSEFSDIVYVMTNDEFEEYTVDEPVEKILECLRLN